MLESGSPSIFTADVSVDSVCLCGVCVQVCVNMWVCMCGWV